MTKSKRRFRGKYIINTHKKINPRSTRQELKKREELKKNQSNCCNAKIEENSDVCSKCKEHCGEIKFCVICDEAIEGYGHNARPLAEGNCCDLCNFKVIERRLNLIWKKDY